jgi:hypothetical protein
LADIRGRSAVQHGLEIEDWAFWSPESRIPMRWREHWEKPGARPLDAKVPDDAIPAAQRRRMSALSKLAVQVALEASGGAAADFLVFASQHGELSRTRELLANIVAGVELSPAAFSQSVHNTSAGLYTIVGKSHAPASSVAAGASTFPYGWLEAEAFLVGSPGCRALLVAYDEALPAEYRAYSSQTQCTYGVALLLRLAARGGLTLATTAPGGDEKLPLAPLFAAWWQSAEPSLRLETDPSPRPETEPSLRLDAEPSLRLTADGQGWLWSRAAV